MIDFKRIITTSLVAMAASFGFVGGDVALASPEGVVAENWNQFDIDHDVRLKAPEGTNVAMCFDLGFFTISFDFLDIFDLSDDASDDNEATDIVTEDD